MLICDLCGSVSVWTGPRRESRSICPLLADLSGELASSLQPLTFLPHYLTAPVSLFLQLWALALFCLYLSSFLSFQILLFLFPLRHDKNSLLHHFSCSLIVLQLPFLYKSLFSPSTCPCRSAQIVPSSSSSCPGLPPPPACVTAALLSLSPTSSV